MYYLPPGRTVILPTIEELPLCSAGGVVKTQKGDNEFTSLKTRHAIHVSTEVEEFALL